MELKTISTEQRNPKTFNIDELEIIGILKTINEEDKTVPITVEKSLGQIAELVKAMVNALRNDGRVIYIGAGTSGRLGVLDAAECPPTFGVPANMFISLIAGGSDAMTTAVEGAEDNKALAIKDLKEINLTDQDIVIGIAASGRTPYTISGMTYAKEIGAKVGCITTSENSKLEEVAHYPIVVVTGPEPITGSTRMKSGTAQKLVLNMLSTTTMIKSGKVYGNLMVDVQMNNKKLIERAHKIISEATGVDYEIASQYLNKYNSPKAAILSIVTGIEGEEVFELLNQYGGNLRDAIKSQTG